MDFKPLITLLAIVNPLAIVPFFIHYTQGFSHAQRKRTIWVSSFSAFVVIAASALLGLQILEFFGISLASFQVGGGRCSTPSPPKPAPMPKRCTTPKPRPPWAQASLWCR
jgi:small neutral amino acid transporter SnatA (MarC family)